MSTVAILGWIFLKIQIMEFPIRKYVTGILRILVAINVSISGVIVCKKLFMKPCIDSNLWRQLLDIVITVLINMLFLTLSSYVIGFNASERKALNSTIAKKIIKLRRI